MFLRESKRRNICCESSWSHRTSGSALDRSGSRAVQGLAGLSSARLHPSAEAWGSGSGTLEPAGELLDDVDGAVFVDSDALHCFAGTDNVWSCSINPELDRCGVSYLASVEGGEGYWTICIENAALGDFYAVKDPGQTIAVRRLLKNHLGHQIDCVSRVNAKFFEKKLLISQRKQLDFGIVLDE